MAAKLDTPPSTVMSWQSKGFIPAWRRPMIMAKAAELGIELHPDELAAPCAAGADPHSQQVEA